MNKSVNKVLGFLIIVLICFSTTLRSQTMSEAVEAFNSGAQLVSDNIDEAIKMFEECIEICNHVGEEGDETRLKAEQQLPRLYFNSSMSLYKEGKLDEAITKFQKTIEVSEKFNDPHLKAKSKGIIPKLYNSKANSTYKAGNLEEAIANYKKAIEYNPEYAKAHMGLGLSYKKQKDIAKMEEALVKAIESGNVNDAKTAGKAKNILAKSFANEGKKALKSQSFDTAIESFKKSLKYNDKNSDAYYYIAYINNNQENWKEAIEACNKSLELNGEGSDEDKAKIYFELGKANAGKGDNTAACDAFKKANFGKLSENASYQMKELQCN